MLKNHNKYTGYLLFLSINNILATVINKNIKYGGK